MLLGTQKGISEIIVSFLAMGSHNTKDLQTKVQGKKKVTKQAFYKALRELVAQEIVLKNKQLVLLNNSWVNKLHNFVATIDEHYQTQAANSLFNLSEGESLIYHFKSIPNLDALWMHYFYLIAKQEKNADIVMYNPHEFWSLVRFEEEQALYKWTKDNKRKTYLIVGNNSTLDKTTTSYIQKYNVQMMYETKSLFKETYYYAIIGDYVLTTIIDQRTAHLIDSLYKKYSSWSIEAAAEMEKILAGLRKSKVIIQKNRNKAEKLHKMLVKKYFTF